jgi:hypothetical protein
MMRIFLPSRTTAQAGSTTPATGEIRPGNSAQTQRHAYYAYWICDKDAIGIPLPEARPSPW